MERADAGTTGPTVAVKVFLPHLVFWCGLAGSASALESWQESLGKMALPVHTPPLNRSNCISVMLEAFQSKATVRALIVLPAVTDDFYLVNRDKPALNIAARDLNEAVTALTQATAVRATFRSPFLLLHLDRDVLEPEYFIKDQPAAERLKQRRRLPHALFCDRHWQTVQPVLQRELGIKFLPAAHSPDAWHFSRHNLAGWNLTNWELLTALSLSGRTAFTVHQSRIEWRPRIRSSPAAP